MSYISMTGAGSVNETADFLKEFFADKCALAAEKRRGDTAFLMLEESSLFARNVCLLVLDISSHGGQVIVDAFGHAYGSIFADDAALPLKAAETLRQRGFTEHERGSWTVSEAAQAEGERERPEPDPISPAELARLGAQGRGRVAGYRRAGQERAEPEKRRAKRGKRSYDPEI